MFVDGCFWHSCTLHGTSPIANGDWWQRKLEANKLRDAETSRHLETLGWSVVRVWEHESASEAARRIITLLDKRRQTL
ncbi:hypothetical protein TPA0908_61710 [Micromonospora sp. AKA38]|nr:hypothetical protein TPA0908_61710 [Micromonospora sp. AKA38]